MLPYGLPRYRDVVECDSVDGKEFGRKSSMLRLPGKSGDIRSHQKSKNKRMARKHFKTRFRNSSKLLCKKDD